MGYDTKYYVGSWEQELKQVLEFLKKNNLHYYNELKREVEIVKMSFMNSQLSIGPVYPDVFTKQKLFMEIKMQGNTCEPVQIFSRVSDQNTHRTKQVILLRPDLFARLSVVEQSAAVLHEAIYSLAYEYFRATGLKPKSNFEVFNNVVRINYLIYDSYLDQLPKSMSSVKTD